jgi:adenosylcobyric acid synthase
MNTLAPCLMIQGTGSGVGKSVLATAFCRWFARAGYRVAPFKSQNMALNASVTVDGGEIGRAQAAQAEAAGIEPTVDMNPILLKPETDHRSQIVVRGQALTTVDFNAYLRMQPTLLPIVAGSLARLRRSYELIVIEGAGSPAEINLREGEIVNMRIARLADAAVILVGDIDRGGVFASLLGTMELLDAGDRKRVGGFIINKFRGDASLLEPGVGVLTSRTGVPVLGVVPHFAERLVPAEDALDLDAATPVVGPIVVDIAVVRLPRISNFDDFEPLAREPGVHVRFARTPAELAAADAIVLPGSKSTIADLQWLRARGLASAISAAAGEGRAVIGVCGGYQMLGHAIRDPEHVESQADTTPGLGLLPVVTTFAATKTTVRVRAAVTADAGPFAGAAGGEVAAYEIHAGRTGGDAAPRPFVVVSRRGAAVREFDGATNGAGTVVGTYLHGLFANGGLRRAFLSHLATRKGEPPADAWGAGESAIDRYDRLADIVDVAVDLRAISKLVGLEPRGADRGRAPDRS